MPDTPDESQVQPEPLFTLDLASNGGLLAPRTTAELQNWISRETSAFTWIDKVQIREGYRQYIDEKLNLLRALELGAKHLTQVQSHPDQRTFVEALSSLKTKISQVFLATRWPHSSNPKFKRVIELSSEDPTAALAYLFVVLRPPAERGFDGKGISSWRGYLKGLLDSYELIDLEDGSLKKHSESLDELRSRMELMLGQKSLAYEQLHRSFEELVKNQAEEEARRQKEFDERLALIADAHKKALDTHSTQLLAIQQTFREQMALRGPVEYWKEKAKNHSGKSSVLMRWTFGSLLALAASMGGVAYWVFSTLHDGKPEAWKVATLVLLGVVGVWAVRLIVRMWLSHTHLATDAEERVTMVQTYLALLESQKMPSDEDRKLVLAPLFRPATDGLVKDESLPHPMLELFTRANQR